MFFKTKIALEAVFLTAVMFWYHSTKFNSAVVESRIVKKQPLAWPAAFVVYTGVFAAALFAWKAVLGGC